GAGEQLPPVAVPLNGRMREDVQTTPEFVSFGPVPLGQEREETIVLRSVTGQPFTVGKIDTDPGLTVKPVTGTGVGSQTYKVVQRSDKSKEQQTQLVFHVLWGEVSKPVRVVVPVSYYGADVTITN